MSSHPENSLPKRGGRPRLSHLLLLAYGLALAAALGVLSLMVLRSTPAEVPTWQVAIGGGALAMLCLGSALLVWRWHSALGVVALLLLVATCFTVAVVETLTAQFAGRGFNENFFFHLEPQSLIIGWAEYSTQVILAMLVLLALVALGAVLIRHTRLSSSLLLSITGLALVVSLLFPAGHSVGRFIEGWLHYRQQISPKPIDNAGLEPLQTLGVRTLDRDRFAITAHAATPRNLILVFLESFDRQFVSNPQWRALTPNMQSLIQRYGEWPNIHSSANVTIEGLISSLCGVLPPMAREADSMLSDQTPLARLPCLSDVLHEAGYHQVFMGGAPQSFSGKDVFFSGHGYDEVLGWNEWSAEEDYRRVRNQWGLHDDHLFAEALDRIEALQAQDQPYNLTLLTLSTHIPGARTPSCQGVEDQPLLLQGIACTDQAVGEFVQALEAQGVLDDTLLVVTADHVTFRTPDTRKLFGEALEDRRLLTVVAGAGAPATPPIGEGASYDLAPTLLGLLGVEHNVDFLLGQDLYKPRTGARYLLSRFIDYHDGRYIENDGARCKQRRQPPSLRPPLDACGKWATMQLMGGYLSQFNAPPSSLPSSCVVFNGARIRFADSQAGTGLSIMIGGKEQLRHFSSNGVLQNPRAPGLYLLRYGADLAVLDREYFDLRFSDRQRALLSRLLDSPDEQLHLAAAQGPDWSLLPAAVRHSLAARFGPLPTQDAVMISRDGSTVIERAQPGEPVVLRADHCEREAPPASGEPFDRLARSALTELDRFLAAPHLEFGSAGTGHGSNFVSQGGKRQQRQLFRGVNVLTIDPATGAVIDRRHFDTYADEAQSGLLIGHLNQQDPSRHLLVLTAAQDIFTRLTDDAREVLAGLGADRIDEIAFRSSWIYAFGAGLAVPVEALHPEGRQLVMRLVRLDAGWQALTGG